MLWYQWDVVGHLIEKIRSVLQSSLHALSYDILLNVVSWIWRSSLILDTNNGGVKVKCLTSLSTHVPPKPSVVLRLSIKTVGNIFGVTLTMMPLSPKLDQLELLLGSTITQNLEMISWKLHENKQTNKLNRLYTPFLLGGEGVIAHVFCTVI